MIKGRARTAKRKKLTDVRFWAFTALFIRSPTLFALPGIIIRRPMQHHLRERNRDAMFLKSILTMAKRSWLLTALDAETCCCSRKSVENQARTCQNSSGGHRAVVGRFATVAVLLGAFQWSTRSTCRIFGGIIHPDVQFKTGGRGVVRPVDDVFLNKLVVGDNDHIVLAGDDARSAQRHFLHFDHPTVYFHQVAGLHRAFQQDDDAGDKIFEHVLQTQDRYQSTRPPNWLPKK